MAGFAVTTAHHLDIGAHTPGSGGIVDAIDCYAEGLRFQAIKVYEAGKKNQQVWNMLRTNIRLPDLVLGDMDAQIAASRIGAQRYTELIELYGLVTIVAASEDMFDSSERMMRSAIRALPDGDYSATTMIDGYLDDPSPARKDLPIKVTIRNRGDEMTVDLTGTAAQVADRPINMPYEGTVDCAIWLSIRSVLLDTTTHGSIPQNSGLVGRSRSSRQRVVWPIRFFRLRSLPASAPASSFRMPSFRRLLKRCRGRCVAVAATAAA